ncbi:SGNH/GDSL hydrolase family protein [Nocardia cyriacigeorgica]|uniref:SGNH/GDSL hydrolase family protein n=1 Tax=Nocardia cyriacigeorgica TaxID=135487 RepID=A0A6P1CTA3_9NOCA|nr:SGNH/GDSL hydrolase family protein [Nocardia cyriacigeorgica]MBF6287293.1 SGNH/GDSL hydrolase family protein [Nocardia cyriacigeorgica]NEW35779.1 SGNH/GDSL hydrolase family protein [Nocardia cyriacigeorgica]
MGDPRIRWRTAAVTGAATVLAGSSAGTASWAAYRYLMAQAGVARGVIGRDTSKPPEADGIYLPGAVRPEPWRLDRHADLHLMIFGDSTAAGVGCTDATEVPGVRLARGLAEATGRSIRLSTKAISGATSKGLSGQVDAMFVAGPPPDAAVILIGGNDITKKHSVGRSAGRLKRAVARLSEAGSVVVVGTCPDLGTVAAIPQPLRSVVHTWSLRLARAQTAVTLTAGGHPVSMGDLLSKDFHAAPEQMFSADGFHPSAAGYALAAEHLLPVLLSALSERDLAVPGVSPSTGAT